MIMVSSSCSARGSRGEEIKEKTPTQPAHLKLANWCEGCLRNHAAGRATNGADKNGIDTEWGDAKGDVAEIVGERA